MEPAHRAWQARLTLAPSGFPEGYTQLIADAEQRLVAATTITVAVASLADVEHSKRTADRAKDRAYLRQVERFGPPEPTAKTPPSGSSVAHDLLRAYARREELRAARAKIADPQTTRRDRARALAYDLGLKAIEEEIAGGLSKATAVRSARSSAPNSTISAVCLRWPERSKCIHQAESACVCAGPCHISPRA